MRKIILLILLCLTISTVAYAEDKKETAYERVVRTKTLRCAYTIYPTFVDKDPNTGKLSGTFYDLTNEIGRQLNIKIDWTEEVGTDTLFEGLKSNRYDAVCAGYFASPSRTWGGDFTRPLAFIPYNLYVRKGEARFKSFDDFNSDKVTIATQDGEMSQVSTNEALPLAKQNSVPGLTPATDRLQMLATGKVDAAPMEAAIGAEYMAHNPEKIEIFGGQPWRVAGSVLIIPHNEFQLKRMLDATIDSMLWTGAIDRILKKNQKHPGTMLTPMQPYQEGK